MILSQNICPLCYLLEHPSAQDCVYEKVEHKYFAQISVQSWCCLRRLRLRLRGEDLYVTVCGKKYPLRFSGKIFLQQLKIFK